MKRIKRLLSMLLSLCIVLGMIPPTAFATGSPLPFTDVKATDWFYDEVLYVYQNELMNGTSNTKFSPDTTTTRGMIVTILHRMEGTPSANGETFDDVSSRKYYSDAVAWASANGIVGGYGDGRFGPDDPITREQMATILYRYAQHKNYDTAAAGDVSAFVDGNQTSTYAVAAMNWSVGAGLISGVQENVLDPSGSATRAQVAAILMRFCNTIIPAVHTVTFDYNYGNKGTYATVEVKDGETVKKPDSPNRYGYYFAGWCATQDGDVSFNFNTPITEDITLYAKWVEIVIYEPEIFYTVSFDMNGHGTAIESQTIVEGGKVTKPADPVAEGFTFGGWFVDEECTTEYDFDAVVTANMILYAKWTGNANCELQIVIRSSDYSDETSSIVTQDDSYLLTGTVENGVVSMVNATYCGYQQLINIAPVIGTDQWSVEIPLEIGTNVVTITAYDTNRGFVTKQVYINRTNTEVVYSDGVKIADIEDYQRLDEDFVACWIDNNLTYDVSDDTIIILAKDDALLLSQIEDGLLAQGEVYMIPQNEIFVTGFTAVYEYHRAPNGTEEYPVTEYPDNGYEEIVFSYPDFADLFASDISLDFSNGVDSENPIAFAMLPDGTAIDLQSASQVSTLSMREGGMIGNPLYPKAGWQPQELAKNALPSAKCEIDQYNRVNLTLNWNDIVIYDHDGVKNEEILDYGQLKLSGKVGITNLQYTSGLEWHPNFIPWELDLLPQQIISKLEYSYGGSLTVKGDASVSTAELVKALNNGFDNKSEFWGLSVSGVSSLKNKWILGVIGLNLVPPCATFGTSITGQAAKAALSPSLILVLFVDLDGNVTVEGALTFGYNTKVKDGYNIQKNGYTGSYGSQNQNRSDKHYNIGFDRTLDIYDENVGEFSLTFGGKVEASLDLGVGVGGGLMIGGICPAMIDNEIFYRANGLVEGEIQFLPEFDPNGYASLYHGIGYQTDLAAKLFVDTKIGDAGFDVNKHFEKMFWEETKSTSYWEGIVYVADDDGNNSNNAVIAGATVTLTKEYEGVGHLPDSESVWTTTTDSNGKYRFTSIPNGKYTIKVEKANYDSYISENVIFSKKLEHYNVFLNERSLEDGICSLSGKITVADNDTDQTNNLPLEGVTVYIVRRDHRYSATEMTGSDGVYTFNNLPSGTYNITISKPGYITVKAEVAIADNVQNYYNAMIEAIAEDFTGFGSASGSVYDALTGYTVADLTLRVRNGINVTAGDVVATTKTDSQGRYVFADLPAGNYTVEVVDERDLSNEEERYFTSAFIIKVLGDMAIPNQNGHVTNRLAADQLRIVLRWGEQPRDLDSHIVGPTADGGSFHVYFSDETHYESSLMVDLDLDDTSSYGPETTTIYQAVSGEYVFMVHDYTNKNETSSSALANSGAYVEIYLGTSTVAAYTFYVPNNEGTLWTVFSYNSETGAITPINTMSYQSSAGSVGSEYYNTADTVSALPDKKDYE